MPVNKRVCQSAQCEQTQAYPLHQCVWVNTYQGGIRQESRHLTNTVLWGYRVQVVEVKQYKILLTSTGEQPITITKYILKQQESPVSKHTALVVRFTNAKLHGTFLCQCSTNAKLRCTFLQLGWIITSNAGNKMRNAIAAMISAFKWSHQYHHTGNITPALSQGHHYNNTQYTKINHLSVAINSQNHSHSH